MTQNNSFARPLTSKELVGPLRIATICTSDLKLYQDLFVSTLKMVSNGPFELDEDEIIKHRKYLGIPEELDFELFHFYNPADIEALNFKVVVLSQPTFLIKNSDKGSYPGLASIGILSTSSVKDSPLNVHPKSKAISGKTNGYISWGQGTKAKISIKSYKGPEFIDMDFIQMNSENSNGLDESIGHQGDLGFVRYNSEYIEEDLNFFKNVIGMESRTVIPKDDDLIESQHILKSKGPFGNFVYLNILNEEVMTFEHGPRIPNCGLVTLTFQTQDIGEILARAHANEIKVYRTPRKIVDVIYGASISMSMIAPSGHIIEVFNTV